MMSEKRFEVVDNSFSMWIVDTTLKEDRHEGNIYTAYEMCDKLNELCEENERLRHEIEINKKWQLEKDRYYVKIKEENEQLKAYKLYEDNKRLQSIIADLKKENERLKNKLNFAALELVDESISMGKAVEISEMNYHEFLEYRQKKGKPMELQK